MIGSSEVASKAAQNYLEAKFGKDLDAAHRAMTKLAKPYRPKELAAVVFALYEQFRPTIPEGVRGWGAKGDLDLGLIASLTQKKGS